MICRCLSYNFIQLIDMVSTNYKKYNSYNDRTNLDTKPNPEYRSVYWNSYNMNKTKYVQPKECVSYSVFLQKYPNSYELRSLEFSRIHSALPPEYSVNASKNSVSKL